jgi:hypothetical protein
MKNNNPKRFYFNCWNKNINKWISFNMFY